MVVAVRTAAPTHSTNGATPVRHRRRKVPDEDHTLGLAALVGGVGLVLVFVAFALGSLTRAVAPAGQGDAKTDGLEPATA